MPGESGENLQGVNQPTGTISIRGDGSRYIKISTEPYSSENWIRVTSPKEFREVVNKLDNQAKILNSFSTPFEGRRVLDKLIVDFYKDKMGLSEDNAVNMPSQFKVWGFYSFTNFFTQIEMSKKINKILKKRKEKRDGEIDLWNEKVKSVGVGGAGDAPFDYDFEGDMVPERPITNFEINGLKDAMAEAIDVVRSGLNFKGERRDVWEKGINDSFEWTQSYRKMPEILKEREENLKEFERVFTGDYDWVIKEKYEYEIGRNFDQYFNKYKDQIMIDEGKRISEEYGLDLHGDIDSFYEKTYEIVDNLNNFEVDSLVKLRFKTMTGKELGGKWNKETIAVVQNAELLADALPLGHFKNNKKLNSLNNDEFSMGYAYYTPSTYAITLSQKMLKETSIEGDLSNPVEFFSTVAHEIGHSVSQYYRDEVNPLGYKRWTYLCGWDNYQKKLEATGTDPNVPREGPLNGSPLISEYSYKSREEAFAEYYSCYFQNQDAIDNWLDTGNTDYLLENEVSKISTINRWIFDKELNRHVKIKQPIVIKQKGIIYRNNIIPLSQLEKDKDRFAFMRKAIFGSKKLSKSIG